METMRNKMQSAGRISNDVVYREKGSGTGEDTQDKGFRPNTYEGDYEV
jgi:hypothetical protein